ncbi:hypothetical protein EGI15_21240 [Chryseobacterium cucumeris]|uniref:Uncharacterized protein n=1 Tax=Chryseobacterium cucumeris TaxID=1813611 RepID=A0ABX9X0I8_9FLAO|nr:hypothetical protein A1704_12620 [Chryseobacterium cucumeris]ROH87544.1 hypothetical protein EGI15_21240 [Chryseobacterium cucumeris]
MRVLTKFKNFGAVFAIILVSKLKILKYFFTNYALEIKQKFSNYLFFCIFAVRFLLKITNNE